MPDPAITHLFAVLPWARAGSKFIGFAAYFSVVGALGYRLVRMRLPAAGADATVGAVLEAADARAAHVGLFGACLLVLDFALELAHEAPAHGGWTAVLRAAKPVDWAELALTPPLIVAFAFAVRKRSRAWTAALVLGLVFAARSVLSGRVRALVNPLHEAAAALWLGTLMVLVIAFLPVALAPATPRDRRGPLVAEVVRRFSPLALFSAAAVGLTGLATAWMHLKYLSALWTTAYGQVLILKLVFVAGIVALGAWNWRRALPALGTEKAAIDLRLSSLTELGVALIVLVVSAMLSSMPSPKLPPAAPAHSTVARVPPGAGPAGG